MKIGTAVRAQALIALLSLEVERIFGKLPPTVEEGEDKDARWTFVH